MNSRSNQIPDRVPAYLSEHIEKGFLEQMDHERFRKKVKEIFTDCVNEVTFMEKVKGYAGKEIDERIFKNGTALFIWTVSLVIASILGAIATKFIH